jgi:hypothetical protein
MARMEAGLATPTTISKNLTGLELNVSVLADIKDLNELHEKVSWMLADLGLYWRQVLRQNSDARRIRVHFNGLESDHFSEAQRAVIQEAFAGFKKTEMFADVSPMFVIGKASKMQKTGVLGVAVDPSTVGSFVADDPAFSRSVYMSVGGVVSENLEGWATQVSQLMRASNHLANYYDDGQNSIDRQKAKEGVNDDASLDLLRDNHNRHALDGNAIRSNADLVDMYLGDSERLQNSVWNLSFISAKLNILMKTVRQAMLAVGASA